MKPAPPVTRARTPRPPGPGRAGELGLLLDDDQAVVFDDRHAVGLRVLDLLQQDPGAALLAAEVLDVRRDRLAQDVVAQDDDALLAVDELLGQSERLGDAAG